MSIEDSEPVGHVTEQVGLWLRVLGIAGWIDVKKGVSFLEIVLSDVVVVDVAEHKKDLLITRGVLCLQSGVGDQE